MKLYNKPVTVDQFIEEFSYEDKQNLLNGMEESISTRPDNFSDETIRLLLEIINADK
jgi:hypothetical protein